MESGYIIFGMGDQSRYVEEILLHENTVHRTLWPTDIDLNKHRYGIVAMGDNFEREKVSKEILEKYPDFIFINAIHPSCIIADDVWLLNRGIIAMAGCIFNVGAEVGDFTFFATGAQIEHDCKIGDYASVSAGSVLGGHVTVGKYAAIALGCTIFDRVKIGENTVVGSGSLVTKDLPNDVLAYGSPAKVIRKRERGERWLK